jgi:uncharacterized membrane protein
VRVFDLYTTMKFVHVISAVAWVGGGIMLDMLIAKAQREGSQVELVALLGRTARFGKTFFTPTAILVLLSGIVMASIGDIFAAPWVSTGFLAIFTSAGLGIGFLGPKSGQLRAMIEARGLKDAEVQALGGRLMLVSRIDLAILAITVALMVFKPGAV